MDLYLRRHDGQAATVEDFIACFAEASGRDLTQFFLWYRQSGTPEVFVSTHHDPAAGTFTLDIRQELKPTPGQDHKQPMVIPLALGLIGPNGEDRPLLTEDGEAIAGVIALTEARQRFVFSGHPTRPVLSINRGFSAPVILKTDLTVGDLAFLARHDSDPYNRWEAIQTLAMRTLVAASRAGAPAPEAGPLVAVLRPLLDEAPSDPAFAAQALALPSEADIAREIGAQVDPDAILAARRELRAALSEALADALAETIATLSPAGPFRPDAASAGRRAIVNVALDLWAATGSDDRLSAVEERFAGADNMTDRLGALAILAQHPGPRRERAFQAFRDRFRGNALILDKWLALQAAIPEAGTLDRVRALMADPDFPMTNPNRLRALVGSFATANATQFNRADGAGYDFLAEVVLDVDRRNPQVAARLLSAFRSWRAMEPVRRARAEAALRRIAAVSPLSADVADIVQRSLG
jgi:aminopeptidase N